MEVLHATCRSQPCLARQDSCNDSNVSPELRRRSIQGYGRSRSQIYPTQTRGQLGVRYENASCPPAVRCADSRNLPGLGRRRGTGLHKANFSSSPYTTGARATPKPNPPNSAPTTPTCGLHHAASQTPPSPLHLPISHRSRSTTPRPCATPSRTSW